MEAEATLEQVQARHRKELKDLQGRITNKKKNATKKTRKTVNDECVDMERQLREKQAAEIAALNGEGKKAELDDITASDGDDSPKEEGEEGADAVADNEDGIVQKLEHEAKHSLEKAAEKLSLGDHSSNSNRNGNSNSVGGDKKRNRQKERLARRAAEQESAMERAELEASTMTDHRAKESEYMKKAFTAHGLTEKDIEPDGHCLFNAVADQLGQNDISLGSNGSMESNEPGYKTVRRAAATYMESHADDFAPFLEEDLAAYVVKMRDTAEWGGQLELTALARRYGVEIRVIQDGRTERIGEDEGKATGKTLWLAYYRHGYGLGEHYNSLRQTPTLATTTTTSTTTTTTG